jgi:flagellar hook-associated protein 2
MAQYTGGGDFTRLAEIGLGFDRSGKLTLDKTIYNAAIQDTPIDVQALFSSAGGGKGAFGALTKLIDGYTASGGLVSNMRERLTEQVKKTTQRMDAMSAQLAQRRSALMAEYNAADLLMTQLKNQASTLSTLDSTYRLF